jgi:hypothetical protein
MYTAAKSAGSARVELFPQTTHIAIASKSARCYWKTQMAIAHTTKNTNVHSSCWSIIKVTACSRGFISSATDSLHYKSYNFSQIEVLLGSLKEQNALICDEKFHEPLL